MEFFLNVTKIFAITIGGSKGDAREGPPEGPNSFIFMQFWAEIRIIIAILEIGAPPGENPGSAADYSKSA